MKLAVCFAPARLNAKNVVKAMATSMRLANNHQCKTLVLGKGALAYVATSDSSSSVSLFRQSDEGNILAVAGVPIKLDGCLDTCLAQAIVGGYKQAIEQLASLDGVFAAVFWNAAAQKLVVFTDPLGLQPLYIARPNQGLLIASELKAFPASGLIKTKMDPAGWGSFVSFDYCIGENTQLEGVSRINAATIITYDAETNHVETKKYWSRPEPAPHMTLDDIDTGELLDIARQEIRGYTQHSHSGYSLLSGGFDSRLIMTLLHEEGLEVQALTLQHQEEYFGADGRLAVQAAKKFNQGKYQLVIPSRHYYESPVFLHYLVLNEVAVPCLNLFITQVVQYLRPEMKAIWDGGGSGVAFSPGHPQFDMFEDFLQAKARPITSLHWQAAEHLFSPDIGEAMREKYTELLNIELSRYPNDGYGIARFLDNNRLRRCVSLDPVQVYGNYVLSFIPCFSRTFWNIAGKFPRKLTCQRQLHLKLYKKHFPEALSIPFCSGGQFFTPNKFTPRLWALKGAGRLCKHTSYYWHRLGRLPIFGSFFQKLGAGSKQRGEANRLVNQVIQLVHPDHNELNAGAVMTIKQTHPPFDWKIRIARNLLFYWQVWHWIMEGQLTTWNAETFLRQKSERKE
ncbi:MAG: hypothetical protein JW709_12120 [Sedimentisphaerales bacterium]|nr:hypothetical protein [Sedimentisphaerales bacterium]